MDSIHPSPSSGNSRSSATQADAEIECLAPTARRLGGVARLLPHGVQAAPVAVGTAGARPSIDENGAEPGGSTPLIRLPARSAQALSTRLRLRVISVATAKDVQPSLGTINWPKIFPMNGCEEAATPSLGMIGWNGFEIGSLGRPLSPNGERPEVLAPASITLEAAGPRWTGGDWTGSLMGRSRWRKRDGGALYSADGWVCKQGYHRHVSKSAASTPERSIQRTYS